MLVVGLTAGGEWRTLVWSKPLKAGALPGPFRIPVSFLGRFGGRGWIRVGRSTGSSERQEGIGAGDGVRLHERNKALKGTTP